jgi:hypothetical protein
LKQNPERADQGASAVSCIGDDDEDIEYGKEYVHTAETVLAEERKLIPVEPADN